VGPRSWSADFQKALRTLGEIGTQLRPLTVGSAFNGLGTHHRVWCETGSLDVMHVYGAEPKASAIRFMMLNDTAPTHCYHDVDDLIKDKASPGHSRGTIDMYCAGFPCQPYSMYQGKGKQPEHHELFQTTLKQIELLKVDQPRCAILENSLGFLKVRTFQGVEQTGVEILEQNLGSSTF